MRCRDQTVGMVLAALGAGLVLSVFFSSGALRLLLGAAALAAGVLLCGRR